MKTSNTIIGVGLSIVLFCCALSAQEPKAPSASQSPNLRKLSIQSLEAGDTKSAIKYAGEWLSKTTNAQAYYYGDVVHDANQIIGLAALKDGRMADAKLYLLKAGATPGSPRLMSSGPNMVLAQKLLDGDQKEAVVQYLDLVAKFWAHTSDERLRKAEEKMPGSSEVLKRSNKQHQEQIDRWKIQIQAGEKPSLNNSKSLA